MSSSHKDWFNKVFTKAKNMAGIDKIHQQITDTNQGLQNLQKIKKGEALTAAAQDESDVFEGTVPFDFDHQNWTKLTQDEESRTQWALPRHSNQQLYNELCQIWQGPEHTVNTIFVDRSLVEVQQADQKLEHFENIPADNDVNYK